MTAVAYAHPTISRFAIADGMLHIGGLPVGLLAERAGATPFFAYERTGLTRRVEEMRRALPDDLHLSYAVKANPMPAVVGQVIARTTRSPSRTEWASRVLRPSASSGACAPRWTYSHVMSASRVPRSATLWRSFRPAPTG